MGMLATSLDVNVSFMRAAFDLINYPDLVVETRVQVKPSSMLLLVVGCLGGLDDNTVFNLAVDLGLGFVDAEDALDPPEESDPVAAVAALAALVRAMLSPASGATPRSVVVMGFPRTEAEAQSLLQADLAVDAVLELRDESSQQEEAGGEASSQQAMEALKTAMAQPGGSPWLSELQWRALPASGQSTEALAALLETHLDSLLRGRLQEIFEQENRDSQGPRANAFAATVFAITDKVTDTVACFSIANPDTTDPPVPPPCVMQVLITAIYERGYTLK